ncbi:MAG: FHS family L-fucose permease-like MFS transporter [Saprospiraceae bacterium]|jgi:FHS family L-fucose permease-like MFS transporter
MTTKAANYKVPFILMVILFFLFGFLTVLNGQLQGPMKALFELSNTESTFLTFAFFTAFVVTGAPAGMLIDKVGYKKTLVVALLVVAGALATFYGAAIAVSFPIFVVASFILGAGITMLQVVANPYIAALGTPETSGSRINLAGAFNSLATTIAPYFAAFVIFGGKDMDNLKVGDVEIPYIGLTVFALLLAALFSRVTLPNINQSAKKESDSTENNDKPAKLEGTAWKFSHLTMGVLAIFCYVGAEVASGNNLKLYLEDLKWDPAAVTLRITLYWGGLMVGRFIGSSIFKNVDNRKGLVVASLGAMALTLLGTFISGEMGVWALTFVGLFHSVMWGYIFGLAIDKLGPYVNQGSGYLLMGVFGGAVIPMAQAKLADITGDWKITFLFIALCQAYMLFYALVGSRIKKSAV